MEFELMINLQNGIGMTKQCPTGFSWTTFLFGLFTPLFRGDFKWFFIMTILTCCTAWLGTFILAFIYNKIYIKDLL